MSLWQRVAQIFASAEPGCDCTLRTQKFSQMRRPSTADSASSCAGLENVVYGLWIVWAWALWRYMQRLNALWANIREEVQHDVDYKRIYEFQ